MSVVTLDDEIIHYEVLGRGRPLFFLHGWVGSWRYWVPTMQAASIQYRAYALDLWGYGDTAKCPANYTLEAQAKLLNDFIETLGIARIGLIGHGLGALVGLAFAQKFPQLVNRLCLSGLPLGAYSLNPRLRSASIIELIEWLLGKIPNTEAAKTDAPKADNQAIFTVLDDLTNFNALEVARQLETPCLLIYGEDDLAVQVPASKIIDTLPGQSHTIIFDQSGHFPMLEEPSKFNRLLSDFFALENGESPRKLQLKEEWKRRIR